LNYVGSIDARPSADGAGHHAHVQLDSPHPHAPADAIIIPDAHLLFNADFTRSGVDLVLSKDHHDFVVHDYFKGEKRAALASPDGAHLNADIVNALTGEVDYAQAAGAPDAGKIIGHVTKLAGSATVIRNGVSIILNMGDNVEKGDVVQSGSNSTVGITFIDGTVFGLSSNARMVLNEMVYDPNGSNNSSLISLVAGTISFVAGETAKHGDMKIDTPVATMGIRGTAVLVEIDFSAPSGGSPDAKFQVLVEPDGTTGSYILYDKTTLAQLAVVNQAGQQIDISQGSISITNTPLSADVQKLINDVFTLKFTDLWNQHPTTSTAQNDTITPQSQGLGLFKVADGTGVVATYYGLGNTGNPVKIGVDSTSLFPHIDIPPTVVAMGGTLQGAGSRGEAVIDVVSGQIRFVDPNPGDAPTASTTFSSFVLQDANHNDITSTLTPQQLAAVQAVETSLILLPDPGNNNNGTVAWTYSIADAKFGFLGPGETLTLTYLAQVETNAVPPFNTIVSAPITITIIGEQIPTIATTSGSITELPGTNNATIDHATGTVTFTDADLTALPVVSAQFTSFSYQNASHTDVTNSLTPQQKADVAAVEAALVLTPASTNANDGSVGWSYDVADSKLDFLAAGETLTLTYTATVSEGPSNSVTEPITVTITGTNDAPTIATTSGSIAELPGTGNATIDHATGTIAFADPDLTDRPAVSTQFTSFTYQNAADQDVTSSLTPQQQADVAALEASLALTPSSANANDGSVGWSYDVADSKLDFLAAGDVLTLSYVATVSDGHGGSASQPLTVTITGTNDQPTIVSESNPLVQNVVVVGSGGPSILGQGINTNAIGLATETFDSQSVGSTSDNGAGHGDFFSAALDAAFSGSGDAGVVNGSFENITGAPFVGPLPGSADTTNYLSIGAGGTETITFAALENAFGLYWGSVDAYNTIDFYNGATLVASFSGNDVSPLFANGNLGSFSSNGYVEFLGLASFDKVVLGTGATNAFEIDNISAGTVHAELAAPIAGTLTVSDADIGDSLTASVSGNATVEYNGSTTLPANVDFDALAAASAIKFDTVTSNGGTEVLDWSYDPTNPNLDFLKAGDTLTVTYQAQVNDGHGSVGSQPLTVSIVGTDPTASMSQFQVVSGTTQNDTFNNVGNGVTIFGGGGQDTFVFKPGFGSATIGDFNVSQDTINIDHTLFASVTALLASAQPIDGGQDTLITDAANDKITLLHVTPAQIQAHAGDFHLV
jgi:VCBS repeat-containing protein